MCERHKTTESEKYPSIDQQYGVLVQKILTEGIEKTDPQGVGNLSICGYTLRYDLSAGRFPLLSLRNLKDSWKPIVGELLLYISGNTNISSLREQGIHFLDKWADATQKQFGYPPGELGPTYSKQWRAYNAGEPAPIDQLAENMKLLVTNPDSRRIATSAWNPGDIKKVFVAPCIRYFQFYHAQNKLSLAFVHGSADVGAGVPFDTAQYALILLMAAKVNNMQPKELVHFMVDAHLYKDQLPHMEELIKREPKQEPRVVIKSKATNLFEFKIDDFELVDYDDSNPKMKIPVAL